MVPYQGLQYGDLFEVVVHDVRDSQSRADVEGVPGLRISTHPHVSRTMRIATDVDGDMTDQISDVRLGEQRDLRHRVLTEHHGVRGHRATPKRAAASASGTVSP